MSRKFLERKATWLDEPLPNRSPQFTEAYVAMLFEPQLFQNHSGPVAFPSDAEHLELRRRALADYLASPKDAENSLGRSIVAEVMGTALLNSTLSRILVEEQLRIFLTTTLLDSSDPGPDYYQKGVDCFLVQGGEPFVGICGIDFTLGDPYTVKDKHSKPGVNYLCAAPTIVFPLQRLRFGGRRSQSIVDYLDEIVAPCISKNGAYTPFAGLASQEAYLWRNEILNTLRTGLTHCEESLNNPKRPFGFVRQYPYMQEVQRKIDYMSKIVQHASAEAQIFPYSD